MSDDTRKVRKKLSTLINSLDDLETRLASMLSQSLPELILGLDTIQQAKLQVVIPYLVYDLVFVYLKTRGLDPKTHPVIAELDRVRQYFDKIKDAEDPAKRQLAIDKVAATRFIKHAIAQAKDTTPSNFPGPSTHIRPNDNDNNNNNHNGGSSSESARARDVRIPVKVTAKMLEREKYLEAVREEALVSDDGGDLEVIDDDNDEGEENEPLDEPDEGGRMPSGEDASPPLRESEFDAASKKKSKGKGKAKAVADSTPPSIPDDPSLSQTATVKRKRPPMDPFAGYGDGPDTHSSATPADTGSTVNASRPSAKLRKIQPIEDISAEASTGTNTPSGGEQQERSKNPRKRSKKKAVS